MLKRYSIPLMVVLAVLISVSSLVLLVNANSLQQARLLEDNARRGVERELQQELESFGATARDTGWWNDLIRYAVHSPDDEWINLNLGSYPHENFKTGLLALITPDNRVLRLFINGQPREPQLPLPESLTRLMAQVRAQPVAGPEAMPHVATGLVKLQNEAVLVAVAQLNPESARWQLPDINQYLLLTGRQLDAALLEQLRADLNLKALSQTQPVAAASHNHLDLKDIDGNPVVRLQIAVPMDSGETHDTMILTFASLAALSLLIIALGWRVMHLFDGKRQANQKLRDEIEFHRQTQQSLYSLQAQLQEQVDQRGSELAEKQGQVSSIFEASADGIITIDNQGRITTVNPAAAEMFGYLETELLGQPVETLLLEQDRHAHQGYVHDSHLTSARIINKARQLWARHKNGRAFPIDLNVAPIKGEGKGHVGVMRDITDRFELEKAREQAIQELSNVLATAAEGYVRLDIDNQITDVNDAFCEILRYSREALIGTSLTDHVHPDSIATLSQQYHNRAHNMQRRYELKISRGDGSTAQLAIKATSVMDSTAGLTGAFAFVSDLTALYENQQALERARDEAERANRAKSAFLSSMSHELRTPLNAILGFAQLLERSKREPLSERQQGQVRHIINGGEHLLSLINEVLDLARIEAGRISLSLEPVAPLAVISESVNLIRNSADDRNIRIELPLPESDLPMVIADRTRFRQTLLNLLSNAVKYNCANGLIELRVDAEPQALRFSIRDTGPGIPADLQGELFKPFSRLGHEGSEIEGTGIGLTITRQLVTMMHGKIGVDSAPDQGSCFWFTLPVSQESTTPLIESPQPQDADASPTLNPARHRILYIEDNPANQQLMQQLLEELTDCQLILSDSAESGIQQALACKPELILMDLNLPGLSGMDAIMQLQTIEPLQNVPVIAVSADALESTQRKALAAGFADYLTKPVQLPQLTTMLQTHLPDELSSPAEDENSVLTV